MVLFVFGFEKIIRWMDVNNIREMEDFSLFEDFKEGLGPRKPKKKVSQGQKIHRQVNNIYDEIQYNVKPAVRVIRGDVLDIKSNLLPTLNTQVNTNNALVTNIQATLNNQTNLNNTLSAVSGSGGSFTTREGFDDLHTGNKLIHYNNDENTIYYLKSIQNQNKSLNDNINYLGGNFSSDNQKFLYQQQHILYWTAANFWMFYIYMILAVVYGLILFIYKEGGLGGKIFWYLHVFFYPYLAIYSEIAGFLFFMYVYCWVVGQPFTVWKYFTSYPSVI